MPTLTVVVPCYNSASYMRRCLDSLLPAAVDLEGLEILIVDDGSWDETAAIADEYAAAFPEHVRVIHQKNAGHGGAINTGLAEATGQYLKIVDSDDWVDEFAYSQVLNLLRDFGSSQEVVDLLVSNFVYEKADRKRPATVRYDGVLPANRVFDWSEVGRFGKRQYMLMHSIIYRTELLRDCGFTLPEHTFYVDNLYALIPLQYVRKLYYLDVDLYRYYIGRDDQSVNEDVMMARVDQQLAVNRAMFASLIATRSGPAMPPELRRYLMHYVEIVSVVTSILLVRVGTPAAMAKKTKLWADLREQDELLYRKLRRGILGQLANLPGRPGRYVSVMAYRVAQRVVGFN